MTSPTAAATTSPTAAATTSQPPVNAPATATTPGKPPTAQVDASARTEHPISDSDTEFDGITHDASDEKSDSGSEWDEDNEGEGNPKAEEESEKVSGSE